MMRPVKEADIEECLHLIRQNKITTVVFDMDQTAVAMHSRGSLARKDVPLFAGKATDGFLRLVPALHAAKIHLAIATHSDQAEYETGNHVHEIDRSTHILGQELATRLLEHCFSPHIASSFFIVAYNPKARGTKQDPLLCMKRFHMREIQKHYGVSSDQILFFDDTEPVVKDCQEYCGVPSVLVDARKGFQLRDLVRFLSCEIALDDSR